MALARKFSPQVIEHRRSQRDERHTRRGGRRSGHMVTQPKRKRSGTALFESVVRPSGYSKPRGVLAPVTARQKERASGRLAKLATVAAVVGIVLLLA